MKSLRSIAAAGLIAAAAVATISLGTGTASAAPGQWTIVGGGYPNLLACQVDGVQDTSDPANNGGYTQFACYPSSTGKWDLWER
ncbi:hypothetical protein [Actinoallomurus sp. NPDC050550]|uniref:hypothetical protein n=1 Tax=Actinoallomurus sp. NPDC050550 TaxID=3154937 RepID=UPI0033C0ACD3